MATYPHQVLTDTLGAIHKCLNLLGKKMTKGEGGGHKNQKKGQTLFMDAP